MKYAVVLALVMLVASVCATPQNDANTYGSVSHDDYSNYLSTGGSASSPDHASSNSQVSQDADGNQQGSSNADAGRFYFF